MTGTPRSLPRPPRAAIPVLLGLALFAAGCGGGPSDADPVRVAVTTDYPAAVPGRAITLVWRFDIAPDWHLYWTGRNDSGFPPTIDLDLPDGWIAGGLQWPAPERHLAEGGILDHVYYDELVLLQKIGVPADAEPGREVRFDATVEWLGCRDACVPGKAVVPLTIPVAAAPGGERSEAWRTAHDALPQPLPAAGYTATWSGQVFHLVPEASDVSLAFMPTADCGPLVDLARDGVGDALAVRFRVEDGMVGPVRGLVTVRSPDGTTRAYAVDFSAQLLTNTNPGG